MAEKKNVEIASHDKDHDIEILNEVTGILYKRLREKYDDSNQVIAKAVLLTKILMDATEKACKQQGFNFEIGRVSIEKRK